MAFTGSAESPPDPSTRAGTGTRHPFRLGIVSWASHDTPYPAGYGFPLPFGSVAAAATVLALASWSVLFPPGGSAFLTVGLLAAQTLSEFPRSAGSRCVRGGWPLYRRDIGVLGSPTRLRTSWALLLIYNASISSLPCQSLSAITRSVIEASLWFIRPNFPWPGFPARLGTSLDVTLRFRPCRYRQRRGGLGTSLDTGSEACASLLPATSCRKREVDF